MTDRRLDEPLLRRFARQVVLPEVGEVGQRKLLDAHVVLVGTGVVHTTAAVYLAASGVGELRLHDPRPVADAAGRFPFTDARPADRRDTALADTLSAGAVGRVEALDDAEIERCRADVIADAGGATGTPLRGPAAVRLTVTVGPDGGAHVARALAARPSHPREALAGPRGYALGALLADAVGREIVLGGAPRHAFAILERGDFVPVRVT